MFTRTTAEVRRESDSGGLFKNIASDCFVCPRVCSARFVKSNNPALDVHPSPECTITIILTLVRLLKRESPAQLFHVGSVDCGRLTGKLHGKFFHINLNMAALRTRH